MNRRRASVFQPPFRAAVIGDTGRGDYGHGLDVALLDQPRLQVVAVADPDPKGRAAAAARLGVDRAYADYREMLEREKPQFVSVAPRCIDRHAEFILACAHHGVRGVFCEKPLAPTLAECDAIVDACDRAHTKLAMAFQTRYSPVLTRVKDLIRDGAIGELLELRGRGKEDRRGGGEDLMVLGSHIMDLYRAIVGDPAWCFARVTAAGKPIDPSDAIPGAEGMKWMAGDRVDAMFGFAGTPVVAHFATSRPAEPGQRFGLQVFGSKGRIDMATGFLPRTTLVQDATWTGTGQNARHIAVTSAGPGQPEPIAQGDAHAANRRIVADLIRAVENDTQPISSVHDGRASVEMILACYASHLKGCPVALPVEERSHHPLEELIRGRTPR
jgi:predicted dehydrogenase